MWLPRAPSSPPKEETRPLKERNTARPSTFSSTSEVERPPLPSSGNSAPTGAFGGGGGFANRFLKAPGDGLNQRVNDLRTGIASGSRG